MMTSNKLQLGVLDSIHMPTEYSNHSRSLSNSFQTRKLCVIVLEKSIFATPVTKFSVLYGTCSFSNKPRIGAQTYPDNLPDNLVYNFTILKLSYSICERMSGSPKQSVSCQVSDRNCVGIYYENLLSTSCLSPCPILLDKFSKFYLVPEHSSL